MGRNADNAQPWNPALENLREPDEKHVWATKEAHAWNAE
eukprot:CAMPEP_0182820640 /NCGR_PEP_ID=MMETSP0006_2-20121128/13237_1 /TAXON_ID=97485 /ORGANISM="Prymnesium parvum, Strain Texoma1" /LENGTH=38 /DNA_ID= /DNA_START= /DNA_END= /DNA_ORIENTATION=